MTLAAMRVFEISSKVAGAVFDSSKCALRYDFPPSKLLSTITRTYLSPIKPNNISPHILTIALSIIRRLRIHNMQSSDSYSPLASQTSVPPSYITTAAPPQVDETAKSTMSDLDTDTSSIVPLTAPPQAHLEIDDTNTPDNIEVESTRHQMREMENFSRYEERIVYSVLFIIGVLAIGGLVLGIILS